MAHWFGGDLRMAESSFEAPGLSRTAVLQYLIRRVLRRTRIFISLQSLSHYAAGHAGYLTSREGRIEDRQSLHVISNCKYRIKRI